MPIKISKEERRQRLLDRQAQSAESSDRVGRYTSFLKYDCQAPVWYCSPAEHLIDILPYFAGNNVPISRYVRNAPKGELEYRCELFIHRNVGLDNAMVVCPNRSYERPCPICEQVSYLLKNGLEYEDEAVKSIIAKKQVIYNIMCYDTPEEENKGIQVWPIAHWNSEKNLDAISRKSTRGGAICFSDLEVGKSVAFVREGSDMTTRYGGYRFVDRDYTYPDDLLEKTYVLDELFEVYSYEKIKEMFIAGQNIGNNPIVDSRQQEEKQQVPSLRVRRQIPSTGSPSSNFVENKTEEFKCPGTFGVDIDQFSECEQCDMYNDCMVAHNASSAKEKEPEPKETVNEETQTETSSRRVPLRRRKVTE